MHILKRKIHNRWKPRPFFYFYGSQYLSLVFIINFLQSPPCFKNTPDIWRNVIRWCISTGADCNHLTLLSTTTHHLHDARYHLQSCATVTLLSGNKLKTSIKLQLIIPISDSQSLSATFSQTFPHNLCWRSSTAWFAQSTEPCTSLEPGGHQTWVNYCQRLSSFDWHVSVRAQNLSVTAEGSLQPDFILWCWKHSRSQISIFKYETPKQKPLKALLVLDTHHYFCLLVNYIKNNIFACVGYINPVD